MRFRWLASPELVCTSPMKSVALWLRSLAAAVLVTALVLAGASCGGPATPNYGGEPAAQPGAPLPREDTGSSVLPRAHTLNGTSHAVGLTITVDDAFVKRENDLSAHIFTTISVENTSSKPRYVHEATIVCGKDLTEISDGYLFRGGKTLEQVATLEPGIKGSWQLYGYQLPAVLPEACRRGGTWFVLEVDVVSAPDPKGLGVGDAAPVPGDEKQYYAVVPIDVSAMLAKLEPWPSSLPRLADVCDSLERALKRALLDTAQRNPLMSCRFEVKKGDRVNYVRGLVNADRDILTRLRIDKSRQNFAGFRVAAFYVPRYSTIYFDYGSAYAGVSFPSESFDWKAVVDKLDLP